MPHIVGGFLEVYENMIDIMLGGEGVYLQGIWDKQLPCGKPSCSETRAFFNNYLLSKVVDFWAFSST